MKRIMAVLLVLTSPFCSSEQFTIAVGFGPQYGGVVGVQFGSKSESLEFNGAVGLLGWSIGGLTPMGQEQTLSWGLSAGQIGFGDDFYQFDSYYMPNGFKNAGWRFGLSVGQTKEEDDWWGGSFEDKSWESYLMVHFGYQF